MKKKEKQGIRLSKMAEKMAVEFSCRNNIPVNEFIDEAIAEKIEFEEIKDESGAQAPEERSYSYFEDRDIFSEEQDVFRKKH